MCGLIGNVNSDSSVPRVLPIPCHTFQLCNALQWDTVEYVMRHLYFQDTDKKFARPSIRFFKNVPVTSDIFHTVRLPQTGTV